MAGILKKIISARYYIPHSLTKFKSNSLELTQLTKIINRSAGSSHKSCEKDEWTKRCGQAEMTRSPCCAMPKKSGSKKGGGYNKKKSDENCEAGRAGRPPCSDQLRIGFKGHKMLTANEMLFHIKDCCPPCLPELPRFDELYYKIRKLGDRSYSRSWSECPKPRVVPKLVCCYENEPFEFPRRPKCHRPPTACPWEVIASKLKTCKKGGDPNCVKVNSPCCCPARDPPTCKKMRRPMCIERIKTPGPCFSECNIKVKALKPSECRCMNKIYACELYDIIDYNKC